MPRRTEIFASEVRKELEENILRFWTDRMPDPSGGFYGRISGTGHTDVEAPKGAVLNARILWAFSAAYLFFRDSRYLTEASRAAEYFIRHFIDSKYGGAYWTVDASGARLDDHKQTYASAFAIYGLSEYVMATGDAEALKQAVNLYRTLETKASDPECGGYVEALARDWSPLEDMRLSDKDMNAAKTMNTHLHVLEAYANLYKVWKDAGLKDRILHLLGLFTARIFDSGTGHLGQFFDREWKHLDSGSFSYGHDIEASWLLLEAAFAINDIDAVNMVSKVCRALAESSSEGMLSDGSMIHGIAPDGTRDGERQWWVQAENIVGNLWAWRYLGRRDGAEKALSCWEYIKSSIIDREHGEWYWGRDAEDRPELSEDKAGLWKCPYHNTRMCLEVLKMFGC